MSGNDAVTSRRHARESEVGAYVSRRVRDLRLACAMTQEDLAGILGVKRESLSRYERGERTITIALLLDIAMALGQPVTALLPSTPGDCPLPTALTAISATLDERPDLIPHVHALLAALSEQPH